VIRVRRSAAFAALGAVALTGCSGVVHAGSAATVGTERIGYDDVRTETTAVLGVLGSSGLPLATLQRLVLQEMLQQRVDDAVGARLGISVTQTQVQQLITMNGGRAAVEQAVLQQVPVSPARLDGVLHDALLRQAISARLAQRAGAAAGGGTATTLLTRAVTAEAGRLHVHVSSRFGRWDGATATITAADGTAPTGAAATAGPGAPAPLSVLDPRAGAVPTPAPAASPAAQQVPAGP